MHGEVAEVEQHLIGGELLFCHILPIENDDGHTQEQVEVVSLWREGKEGRESAQGDVKHGMFKSTM